MTYPFHLVSPMCCFVCWPRDTKRTKARKWKKKGITRDLIPLLVCLPTYNICENYEMTKNSHLWAVNKEISRVQLSFARFSIFIQWFSRRCHGRGERWENSARSRKQSVYRIAGYNRPLAHWKKKVVLEAVHMIPEWLSFQNEFIPSPYVSLYLFTWYGDES